MVIQNDKGQKFIRWNNLHLIIGNNMSAHMVEVIERGEYEREEAACVQSHVNEEDIVLELGSGIGALSAYILANTAVKKYVCVEANKALVQLSQKNHAINGINNCQFVWGVMTNDPEQKEFDFYVNKDFWGSSLVPFKNYTKKEKVPGYLFNDCILEHKPSFLVCDIEGGEYKLFRRGLDLASVSKICIELHNYVASERDVVDFYAFMADNGFTLREKRRGQVLFFSRE